MFTKIIDEIKDKRILILGFGTEGKETYNFIRKYLPSQKITIADINTSLRENNSFLLNDKNVFFKLGNDYLNNLDEFNMIIKSPGVCIKDININRDNLTSQVELFLKAFKNNTIGITGTKGKSTTSSLIYKALIDQGYNVRLLGNIGTSVFENIEEIDEKTIIVLELSSDQLTFVNNSPHISIWLNVFEEHLDHYNSYQDYINAKGNIHKYQSNDDYFIYNADNQDLLNNIDDINCNIYKFSLQNRSNGDNYIYLDNGYLYINSNGNKIKLFDIDEPRNLLGLHNLNNIMALFAVSDIFNLNKEKVVESIKTYATLPHRLENIGIYNEVEYFDDSISTIPESCIGAIETIKNIDTIIIGGKDRGISYKKLIDYISTKKDLNIICMPDTGYIIADAINSDKCYKVNNLEEAVRCAVKVTKKGKACVLSPAASSYGFFKNYIERGNEFRRLVKELN
jgi:UDP-N-acetylmuramoylalanine--D-glutamate ligase